MTSFYYNYQNSSVFMGGKVFEKCCYIIAVLIGSNSSRVSPLSWPRNFNLFFFSSLKKIDDIYQKVKTKPSNTHPHPP